MNQDNVPPARVNHRFTFLFFFLFIFHIHPCFFTFLTPERGASDAMIGRHCHGDKRLSRDKTRKQAPTVARNNRDELATARGQVGNGSRGQANPTTGNARTNHIIFFILFVVVSFT
jgi:hypothetical protein